MSINFGECSVRDCTNGIHKVTVYCTGQFRCVFILTPYYIELHGAMHDEEEKRGGVVHHHTLRSSYFSSNLNEILLEFMYPRSFLLLGIRY